MGELLGLVAFHPSGGYPAAVRVALALIAGQVWVGLPVGAEAVE
jgi:hypothetical protein